MAPAAAAQEPSEWRKADVVTEDGEDNRESQALNRRLVESTYAR